MGNDKHETENYDDYKNYTDQLENEYLTTFEKIEIYINESTKLNFYQKNNCFLQILDSFLSGQSEGKSLKDITGLNLKKYCDDMIYGQTIYIYKVSRVCFILLGALLYVSYMHFFIRICKAIDLQDSSIIFQPMKFGIGEIVLILGYLLIPKLISILNRNYFENPKGCKKIKKYTYWFLWFFTISIYSLMKEPFNVYGIFISFSSIVLILIYSTIVSVAIWLVTEIFKRGNFESVVKEKRHTYYELLNRDYEKHKLKCGKRNKSPLDWNKFLNKKFKYNYLFIIVFSLYVIMFLVLAVFLGWGMLVDGTIDAVGIIILIVVSFLDLFMVLAVTDGIYRNKQLAQMKSQ